jgi:hypothetical protein
MKSLKGLFICLEIFKISMVFSPDSLFLGNPEYGRETLNHATGKS